MMHDNTTLGLLVSALCVVGAVALFHLWSRGSKPKDLQRVEPGPSLGRPRSLSTHARRLSVGLAAPEISTDEEALSVPQRDWMWPCMYIADEEVHLAVPVRRGSYHNCLRIQAHIHRVLGHVAHYPLTRRGSTSWASLV